VANEPILTESVDLPDIAEMLLAQIVQWENNRVEQVTLSDLKSKVSSLEEEAITPRF